MAETKRLYRSLDNRYIGGVCGGLAKYFEMDVVIIRLLFFLALVLGGGGFIAYVVLWIVVPDEPINSYNMNQQDKEEKFAEPQENDLEQKEQKKEGKKHQKSRGNLIGGLVLLTLGVLFLLDNFTQVDFGDLWPVLLIVAGVAVLLNSFNQKNKS
jgi:phage shock protein PspC (stress-responsive transcriptional regulator)